MVTRAAYTVEVAFSQELTGIFRCGISLVGGPDVVSGSFGSNTFDILNEVENIQIERGFDANTGTLGGGRCTLTLLDPAGRYNPENAASPLAEYLRPMRPMRIQATHSSVNAGEPIGLFYGFAAFIGHDPSFDVRRSTIVGVDFFEWLNTVTPVITTTGVTTVGAVIGLILDYVEWTDPAYRSLDTGDTLTTWTADGSKTAAVLLGDLLAVDRGAFFVDGAGRVCYRDRQSIYVSRAPVATFPATLVDQFKPSTDVSGVINRQRVTRDGGVEQVATNDTSRRAYGWRDGGVITSPHLRDDTQANNLAAFIVAFEGDPRPPVRSVELVDVSDDHLVQILSRELTDLVTLTAGGTSVTGTIEKVSHEITNTKHHRSIYAIRKRLVNVFTCGVSLVGGADVVGY